MLFRSHDLGDGLEPAAQTPGRVEYGELLRSESALRAGDEGEGMLSFPMRGTSVAADFPARDDVQSIVDSLNAHLIELGGRVYLAKDRYTRAADYRRMDKRLEPWLAVKKKYDPQGRLRSAQSARLELT